VAATEWSLLSEPLNPAQHLAHCLTGVAPRAALLTALHQLATSARLVQDGHAHEHGPPAAGSAPGGFVVAAEAAGVGLWNSWMQVRECCGCARALAYVAACRPTHRH
jgi:hypothetical protein